MASLRVLFMTKNIRPLIGTFGRHASTYRHHQSLNDDELIKAFTSPEGLPRVSGRPFLPGSDGNPMPKYLKAPDTNFPHCISASDLDICWNKSPEKFTEKVKSVFREKVPVHGAVLLRGLPLKNDIDFARFNSLLGYKPFKYEGGLGVRDTVAKNVMTASREPAPYTIECHNEMSYTTKWPLYLMLFAETPAKPRCGGESVLTDVRIIGRELNGDVVSKFKRLGTRITQLLPHKDNTDYLSWQETFKCKSQSDAEQRLIASGFDYKWTEDNSLRYWINLPPTRFHHETGEEVWFNQVHMNVTYFRANPEWCERLENVADDQCPYHTYYGDGSDIEPEVLQHVRDVTWRNAVGLQLQKGDLLFLDNMYIQHGRLGFVGERRILVSLIDSKL